MSLLRDAKYIRMVAEAHQMPPVSEDACRTFLATTELVIRIVLFRCGRLCRQLCRRQMHAEELQAVISDMNLDYLLHACSGKNTYVLDDAGNWELDPTELPIQAEMQAIVEKRIRPPPALEIHCEWLCFQGTVCYSPPAPATEVVAAQTPPLQPSLPGKNVYIVREVAPHFLSAEASDFLATLTGIAEEYFRLIDRELTRISYRKWRYAVSVLQSHTRLQVLLPALMLYILRTSVDSAGNAPPQRLRQEDAAARHARGPGRQPPPQRRGPPAHRAALSAARGDVAHRLAQRQRQGGRFPHEVRTVACTPRAAVRSQATA